MHVDLEVEVCEILLMATRAIVEHAEDIAIHTVKKDEKTVFRICVSPSDLGRIIGLQGRTARAIRTIVAAIGARRGWTFGVDISDTAEGSEG
jgi:predicted RNA-binding protein YlqC (UPF0109 family)